MDAGIAFQLRENRNDQFDREGIRYDCIWIIVDKDNFVKAACWSEAFRDYHLRTHPDHVAIRYEKVNPNPPDCLGEDQ